MKKRFFAFCAGLLFSLGCAADPAPDASSTQHFLDGFYAALKRHDVPALTGMIAPDTPVVVFFAEEGPEQKFTLSRAEYLQQIRAVWHFASSESYTIKDVSYHGAQPDGTALVSLEETDSRILLGNQSGQRNRLEIRIAAQQGTLRIVGIKTHTIIW